MASSADASTKKLSELRVIDLKSELEKRRQDTKGVKAVLCERLQKSLKEEGFDPSIYLFAINIESPARKGTPIQTESIASNSTENNMDAGSEKLESQDDSREDGDGVEEEIEDIEDEELEVIEDIKGDEDYVEEEEEDDEMITLSVEDEDKLLSGTEESQQEQVTSKELKHKSVKQEIDSQPNTEKSNSDKATDVKVQEVVKEETADGSYAEDTSVDDSGMDSMFEMPTPSSARVLHPLTVEDTIAMDTSQAPKPEDDVSLVVHVDEPDESLDYDIRNGTPKPGADSESITSEQQVEVTIDKASANVSSTSGDETSATNTVAGNGTKKTEDKKKEASTDIKKEGEKGEVKSTVAKDAKTVAKNEKGRSTSAVSSKNLWIIGLSSSTRATDLKALFSKYGKVAGAKVVTNARSPGSRCYGFVTMTSPEEASKCIQHLHRTELHGRMISVERAKHDPSAPRPASKVVAAVKPGTKTVPKKEEKDVKVGQKEGEKKDSENKTDLKKDDKKTDKKETRHHRDSRGSHHHSSHRRSSTSGRSNRRAGHTSRNSTSEKDKTETTTQKSAEESKKASTDTENKAEENKDTVADAEETKPEPESTEGEKKQPERDDGKKKNVVPFNKIKAQRDNRDQRRRVDKMRYDAERRRKIMLEREQRRQHQIDFQQRQEALRLEREREKLRFERERLMREKQETIRMERERINLEIARREREKLEQEREARRIQQLRMQQDQQRRAVKRPYEGRGPRDDPYWDNKRPAPASQFNRQANFENRRISDTRPSPRGQDNNRATQRGDTRIAKPQVNARDRTRVDYNHRNVMESTQSNAANYNRRVERVPDRTPDRTDKRDRNLDPVTPSSREGSRPVRYERGDNDKRYTGPRGRGGAPAVNRDRDERKLEDRGRGADRYDRFASDRGNQRQSGPARGHHSAPPARDNRQVVESRNIHQDRDSRAGAGAGGGGSGGGASRGPENVRSGATSRGSQQQPTRYDTDSRDQSNRSYGDRDNRQQHGSRDWHGNQSSRNERGSGGGGQWTSSRGGGGDASSSNRQSSGTADRWQGAMSSQSIDRRQTVMSSQPVGLSGMSSSLLPNPAATVYLGAAAQAANLMMNAGAFSARPTDNRFDAYKGMANIRRY